MRNVVRFSSKLAINREYKLIGSNSFNLGTSSGNLSVNSSDRFIPQRYSQSSEAASFKLTKQPIQKKSSATYLDVLGQINSLDTSWRKAIAHRALVSLDMFHGLKDHRILKFNSHKYQETVQQSNNWNNSDYGDDWKWNVKPRKYPLIGSPIKKIEVIGLRSDHCDNGKLDWGGKANSIVIARNKCLTFFDHMHLARGTCSIVNIEASFKGSREIHCVKWSHCGNYIGLYSPSIGICTFDVASDHINWISYCPCKAQVDIPCDVKFIRWSEDDKFLITGCDVGRISIFRNASVPNTYVTSSQAHSLAILNMQFSPTYRYISSIGIDKRVRVYLFPEMIPWLDITYREVPGALAWHPWVSGLLCIGGGFGDGSLSFWDIPNHTSIGYKRVNFFSQIKHLVWNKLSGELVVTWYYWSEDSDDRKCVIPVLANANKIVDVIASTRLKPNITSISNVIWNLDHTKLAALVNNTIYIWDMFKDQVSNWSKKKPRKRNFSKLNLNNLQLIR